MQEIDIDADFESWQARSNDHSSSAEQNVDRKVNLERFRRAQEADFSLAMEEIRRGRKESHWMWFIFPQLKGLGSSGVASYYGLSGFREAQAYLADAELGGNLRAATQAMLTLPESDPSVVVGNPDDLKLCSCWTLFYLASSDETSRGLFQAALDKFFGGKLDEKTVAMVQEP